MPAPDTNFANSLNNASWMETLFQGFAQYSQTINKAVGGALGGIASIFDVYGLYATYRTAQPEQQRKTKLLTYATSFALNGLYACGAIFKFLSTLGLSILTVGIDFVALARISYITHQARNAVKDTKAEMEKLADGYEHLHHNSRQQRAVFGALSARLNYQREHRFQSKVEVGYTVASTITSCMFIAGVFFPPLFTAGLIALITVKVVQLIDYRVNLTLSRFLGSAFNKVTHPEKKPLVTESQPAPPESPKMVHCVPRTHSLPAQTQKVSSRVNTDFNRAINGLTAGYTRLFRKDSISIQERHSADLRRIFHSHRR